MGYLCQHQMAAIDIKQSKDNDSLFKYEKNNLNYI